MRILVVEQDFLVAFEVDDALKQAGHVVELAPTADRALAFAARHGADLAVVDVALCDGSIDCKSLAQRLYDEFGVRTMFVNGRIRAGRGFASQTPQTLSQPFSTADLTTAVDFAERMMGDEGVALRSWPAVAEQRRAAG